jgi:protein-S-isoprenylcysteine O-methyltransferase Ste14
MLARALLAFLALPGLLAGVVPCAIGLVDPWRGDGYRSGLAVMAVGLAVLLRCVRDFYVSGKGTLAPWSPPRRLVVVGLYRKTRNPMYLGVLTLVAGWALGFGSPLLAVYVLLLAAGFHRRVVRHEEPWLARRFGAEWTAYAGTVPRWLPRHRRPLSFA